MNIIQKISKQGKHKIYNVASGNNIKSKILLDKITELTDSTYEVAPNSPEYSFPKISIKKIRKEFEFEPISIVDKLEDIVNSFKTFYSSKT